MRKILSEKELERKRKTNTLLISIVMLGVLVVGTVGYGFLSNSDTSSNEEGIESNIRNVGNVWEIQYDGKIFYLQNSPDDVKNISITIRKNLASYSNSQIYIDSENNAVATEIVSVLNKYSTRVQKACYGSCPEKDLPEKNCTENLIVWKDSIENKIYQEENCVFIEGDLKAVDAFLYKLLGFI